MRRKEIEMSFQNKNRVFDKIWFMKHQPHLLWLANTKFGRDVLCINGERSSVGKNKIIKIDRNSITWKNYEGKLVTEFRTHNKYEKRMYYGFKHIWNAFHWFDMNLANKYVPALNLGFDTLTVYPEPGTTVDGYARYAIAGSWTSIVTSGTGTDANYTDGANKNVIYYATSPDPNQYSQLYRAIFLFGTSSLTSNAEISDAVYSLVGTSKENTIGGSPTFNVYSSNPAANNTLTSNDYTTLGSTAFCDTAISYASYSTSGYNDWTLNATGKSSISKTGITKFGLREATYDVPDNAPPYIASRYTAIKIDYSDTTGTSTDPKLTITYTLSATNTGNMFLDF